MFDIKVLRSLVRVTLFTFSCLWTASLGAVTIDALHDTYITSANPSQKSAGSQFLGANSQATTLLYFSLNPLPSGTIDSQIAKATLHLWISQTTPNPFGSIVVYRVSSYWNGTEVTYNTKPSYGGPGMLGSFGGLGYYIEVDVTDHVKAWVSNPSTNYGVAIVPYNSTTNVFFDSKENTGTSHPPYLDVTWRPKPDNSGAVTPFSVCTSYVVAGSGSDSCSCNRIISKTVVCDGGSCRTSGTTNSCTGNSSVGGNFGPPRSCGSCCVCN